MKTAMVWSIPGAPTQPLTYGAHIGTYSLAAVCGLDVLYWPVGDEPPANVIDYDVLIVNLFGKMEHVTQIKRVHPSCLVVALPDSYFDDLFRQGNAAVGIPFLRQLQAADFVGYVSESNRQFYGALLNKPMVYIPHCIGTADYFEVARQQPKEDFLLTVDHIEHAGQRPLDYTAQNVAAVAAIQRETGIKVIYVNAGDETRQYAEIAGLKAEFHGYMEYHLFVRLTARARLGVDMYALHGFGRNELTFAYAGTPCIGSTYTQFSLLDVDPWYPQNGVEVAELFLTRYDDWQSMGIQQAEEQHGFAAARKQMTDTLERLETWRLQPSS